jgi:hypothetical protein
MRYQHNRALNNNYTMKRNLRLCLTAIREMEFILVDIMGRYRSQSLLIYLFICGLFNDAVNSDYVVSNYRMTNEY